MAPGSGDVELEKLGNERTGSRCNVRIEHAGKGGGLANLDSVEVDGDDNDNEKEGKVMEPPHYHQSYHGSMRYSFNGDDPPEKKKALRRRAILLGSCGTIVGFIIIIALGYAWGSRNWKCLPWERVSSTLDFARDSDYLFMIGNEAGLSMVHAKGTGYPAMRDRIRVASGSKWVSAAVLLAMVQDGKLSLDDHPQRHLENWGGKSAAPATEDLDPRRRVTLRQLLAFTSGVSSAGNGIGCNPSENPLESTFVRCAGTIFNGLEKEDIVPGEEFVYSWRHLAIAVGMAEAATGSFWNELVRDYIAGPLGMKDDPEFPLGPSGPSEGLEISPADYALFLTALMRGDSGGMAGVVKQGMFQDMTADVPNSNLTVFKSFPGDVYEKVQRWHHSFGHWIECYQSDHEWTGSCDQGGSSVILHQSFGAFGFYPVISSPTQAGAKRHWAIVAMKPDYLTGSAVSGSLDIYRSAYQEIVMASEGLMRDKEKGGKWPVGCSKGLGLNQKR